MTRIPALSGASLAHPQLGYHRENAPREPGSGRNGSDRRQRGNRRMGDRRASARSGHGRRASDRHFQQSSPEWLSADFTAHLVGQSTPQSDQNLNAQRAYRAAASAGVRKSKGGLV
ncbi:MAG: hypothetical protein CMK07_14195 [Ponticaulis sp.]|nr:hypothetical protein [Ponticaulis sp.]